MFKKDKLKISHGKWAVHKRKLLKQSICFLMAFSILSSDVIPVISEIINPAQEAYAEPSGDDESSGPGDDDDDDDGGSGLFAWFSNLFKTDEKTIANNIQANDKTKLQSALTGPGGYTTTDLYSAISDVPKMQATLDEYMTMKYMTVQDIEKYKQAVYLSQFVKPLTQTFPAFLEEMENDQEIDKEEEIEGIKFSELLSWVKDVNFKTYIYKSKDQKNFEPASVADLFTSKGGYSLYIKDTYYLPATSAIQTKDANANQHYDGYEYQEAKYNTSTNIQNTDPKAWLPFVDYNFRSGTQNSTLSSLTLNVVDSYKCVFSYSLSSVAALTVMVNEYAKADPTFNIDHLNDAIGAKDLGIDSFGNFITYEEEYMLLPMMLNPILMAKDDGNSGSMHGNEQFALYNYLIKSQYSDMAGMNDGVGSNREYNVFTSKKFGDQHKARWATNLLLLTNPKDYYHSYYVMTFQDNGRDMPLGNLPSGDKSPKGDAKALLSASGGVVTGYADSALLYIKGTADLNNRSWFVPAIKVKSYPTHTVCILPREDIGLSDGGSASKASYTGSGNYDIGAFEQSQQTSNQAIASVTADEAIWITKKESGEWYMYEYKPQSSGPISYNGHKYDASGQRRRLVRECYKWVKKEIDSNGNATYYVMKPDSNLKTVPEDKIFDPAKDIYVVSAEKNADGSLTAVEKAEADGPDGTDTKVVNVAGNGQTLVTTSVTGLPKAEFADDTVRKKLEAGGWEIVDDVDGNSFLYHFRIYHVSAATKSNFSQYTISTDHDYVIDTLAAGKIDNLASVEKELNTAPEDKKSDILQSYPCLLWPEDFYIAALEREERPAFVLARKKKETVAAEKEAAKKAAGSSASASPDVDKDSLLDFNTVDINFKNAKGNTISTVSGFTTVNTHNGSEYMYPNIYDLEPKMAFEIFKLYASTTLLDGILMFDEEKWNTMIDTTRDFLVKEKETLQTMDATVKNEYELKINKNVVDDSATDEDKLKMKDMAMLGCDVYGSDIAMNISVHNGNSVSATENVVMNYQSLLFSLFKNTNRSTGRLSKLSGISEEDKEELRKVTEMDVLNRTAEMLKHPIKTFIKYVAGFFQAIHTGLTEGNLDSLFYITKGNIPTILSTLTKWVFTISIIILTIKLCIIVLAMLFNKNYDFRTAFGDTVKAFTVLATPIFMLNLLLAGIKTISDTGLRTTNVNYTAIFLDGALDKSIQSDADTSNLDEASLYFIEQFEKQREDTVGLNELDVAKYNSMSGNLYYDTLNLNEVDGLMQQLSYPYYDGTDSGHFVCSFEDYYEKSIFYYFLDYYLNSYVADKGVSMSGEWQTELRTALQSNTGWLKKKYTDRSFVYGESASKSNRNARLADIFGLGYLFYQDGKNQDQRGYPLPIEIMDTFIDEPDYYATTANQYWSCILSNDVFFDKSDARKKKLGRTVSNSSKINLYLDKPVYYRRALADTRTTLISNSKKSLNADVQPVILAGEAIKTSGNYRGDQFLQLEKKLWSVNERIYSSMLRYLKVRKSSIHDYTDIVVAASISTFEFNKAFGAQGFLHKTQLQPIDFNKADMSLDIVLRTIFNSSQAITNGGELMYEICLGSFGIIVAFNIILAEILLWVFVFVRQIHLIFVYLFTAYACIVTYGLRNRTKNKAWLGVFLQTLMFWGSQCAVVLTFYALSNMNVKAGSFLMILISIGLLAGSIVGTAAAVLALWFTLKNWRDLGGQVFAEKLTAMASNISGKLNGGLKSNRTEINSDSTEGLHGDDNTDLPAVIDEESTELAADTRAASGALDRAEVDANYPEGGFTAGDTNSDGSFTAAGRSSQMGMQESSSESMRQARSASQSSSRSRSVGRETTTRTINKDGSVTETIVKEYAHETEDLKSQVQSAFEQMRQQASAMQASQQEVFMSSDTMGHETNAANSQIYDVVPDSTVIGVTPVESSSPVVDVTPRESSSPVVDVTPVEYDMSYNNNNN